VFHFFVAIVHYFGETPYTQPIHIRFTNQTGMVLLYNMLILRYRHYNLFYQDKMCWTINVFVKNMGLPMPYANLRYNTVPF
jgi:hypothetical protein